MGTFHDNKGELHGITVVVDTTGPMLYVGRCDEMDERRVVLVDVGVHEDGRDGLGKKEYLRHTVQFGVTKRCDRLEVPRGEVATLQRLGEIPVE